MQGPGPVRTPHRSGVMPGAHWAAANWKQADGVGVAGIAWD
jgi:hypothetical protein